jgi:hypothetical protein
MIAALDARLRHWSLRNLRCGSNNDLIECRDCIAVGPDGNAGLWLYVAQPGSRSPPHEK